MEILTKGTMFSEPEYLTAKKILEDFSSEPFSDLEHFSAPVSGQTFDASFPGSRIRNPNFTNCSFFGTQFEGNDATSALLIKCEFNLAISSRQNFTHQHLRTVDVQIVISVTHRCRI